MAWLQHLSLGLLKEMLLALDLAQALGTPADRKAADRLQRRSARWSRHGWLACSASRVARRDSSAMIAVRISPSSLSTCRPFWLQAVS